MKGKVFLVGAGPGDPGLITVKGLECIRQADVIIYDRLVEERLLAEARGDAELLYVGKSAKGHTLPQGKINALLVAKAREGKIVVRLKGGDPFVFGRGGEEAEELAARGIPFEVVPGVSAAVAVPAYAGIPVTHRDFTSSLAVVTGHEDPTKEGSRIAWDKLATGAGTLVFLMGAENLEAIASELMKHGRPPTTPAAFIRWGTGPRQKTITGTLEDIAGKVKEAGLGPPAVVVVGEVVRLREKLRWFDNRPLFGKRVLVTRSRKQASALSQALAQEGAEPIELPVIEIEPADPSRLDRALSHLADYTWVIFTSANGVEVFFSRLRERGLDARELKGLSLCAIGPATAQALASYSLKADLVAQDYSTQGILEEFTKRGLSGKRFLLPRAEIAGEELGRGLSHLGAVVEQIAVYRTLPASGEDSPGKRMLLDGEIDIVTFTSSSTVRHLVALLGDRPDVLEKTRVACIGPVTARAAAELGVRVDIVAREHTIPGLVKALVEGCHEDQG